MLKDYQTMKLKSRLRKRIREAEQLLREFKPERHEHKTTRAFKDKSKYSRKQKYRSTFE